MPRIEGTSNRQSSFLRAFRLHHGGPPPEAWPSPAILRRWLRHHGFRRAFTDLQRTLKTALSFQSLTTGLAAAQSLHHALVSPPAPDPDLNPEPRTLNPSQRLELHRERLRNRTALTFLRLAHARLSKPPPRRRPTAAAPAPEKKTHPDADDDDREVTYEEAAALLLHPNCRPEVGIAFLKGEPHPYFDEPVYDMTTNPPTFIRPPNPAAVARAKAAHDEAVALIKAEYARRGETPPPDLVAPYTPRDPYAASDNAANANAAVNAPPPAHRTR